VRKAVHFLQLQPLPIEQPNDSTAALGTEVEGQDFASSGHNDCAGRIFAANQSVMVRESSAVRQSRGRMELRPDMATATATETAATVGKAVVLYDGECPLCQKSVGILKRLDWLRRLHYQNCRELDRLPPSPVPLDEQKMLEEMHLVTPRR